MSIETEDYFVVILFIPTNVLTSKLIKYAHLRDFKIDQFFIAKHIVRKKNFKSFAYSKDTYI